MFSKAEFRWLLQVLRDIDRFNCGNKENSNGSYIICGLHKAPYIYIVFRLYCDLSQQGPKITHTSLTNALSLSVFLCSATLKMPPNATSTSACTGVLNEGDAETIDGGLLTDIGKLKKAEKRKLKFVWRNIIAFAYLHVAALYGIWLVLTSAKLQTSAFGE